jgi:DNA-binding GntR family transcriptional regulator
MQRAIDNDDEMATIQSSRLFHELVVESCGNETIRIVVGAIEGLWSAHEQAWVREATLRGAFPEKPMPERCLAEHGEIVELIESGDIDGAAAACRRHLESVQEFPLQTPARPIDATSMRSRYSD